jgi:hypothetical protein
LIFSLSCGHRVLTVLSQFLGNETKLGMSRGVPEPKLTAMDAMIDKLTGAIFLFQLAVVVVLGSAGNVWKDTEARKVMFLQLISWLLLISASFYCQIVSLQSTPTLYLCNRK